MKNKTSKTRCKRGFSLIELLVVVLIIGILAAVALPQYQKAVWKARMAEVFSNIHTLQTALDAYVLENGLPTGAVSPLEENKLNIALPASNIASYETWVVSEGSYGIHVEDKPKKDIWLTIERMSPTSPWEYTCGYTENTPSKLTCQELEKQGWTNMGVW